MRKLPRVNRKGVVIAWVAIALVVLLGMAALTIDLGQLCIAAQTAQDAADGAALAGGHKLPDYATASSVALGLVQVNNESTGGYQAVCTADDTQFWGPGDTIPDFGPLGPDARGIEVTARVPVEYAFAKIFGLNQTVVKRSATVVRMPAGGLPIAPMWLSSGTDYENTEQPVELLMAGSLEAMDIPGSFGFLEPVSGDTSMFEELLSGYNLTEEQRLSNSAEIGDILTAYTGVNTGQWRGALERNQPDPIARLQRAASPEWAEHTLDTYSAENPIPINHPCLMLIPVCTYLGGTGTGAQFQVEAFAAFWLTDVNSDEELAHFSISGYFVEWVYIPPIPGSTGYAMIEATGIWTVKLVR